MSVKVGQEMSGPRIVLGVFLFNATIDSFEAASDDTVKYPVIVGGNTAVGPPPPHNRSLNRPVQPEYDRPGFKGWESFLLSVLK